MGALIADDVALCRGHVNSYPLDSLGGLFPDSVLDNAGFERLDPRDVVLKPSLIPHAVAQ